MKHIHNICVNTDSYKASMFTQYPENTEIVFSYIESRGGKYENTVFFGLQAYLKEYLSIPVTMEMVEFADKFWKAHGEPFNLEVWEYIVTEHEGKLPIKIRAVKEGTVVPVKNVLVTIENTDPKCFWLTTWLETSLLRAVWYPTTVATQSWTIKQLIKSYLEKTGDVAGLPFKLHDFGMRGVSSHESGALGASAHLVNFMGTDTVSGILAASEYYGEEMAGFSIPAMEHSTVTSWGRENEVNAYRNMLKQYGKPNAILACVSDSYDITNACVNLWGKELRQEVIDSGAIVVVRPDSGTPEVVVSQCLRHLDAAFGHTVNSKGYKVLNHVRVIQGDGINYDSIHRILEAATSIGYSADNVAYGMGGQMLQIVNRDTQMWAMKCSAAKINGKWIDVHKDPIGDSSKKSKKGRLTLLKRIDGRPFANGECIITVTEQEADNINDNCVELLETVWENGKLIRDQSFAEIRELSNR
jgi:nicotinamide phosphoribosyltransferase